MNINFKILLSTFFAILSLCLILSACEPGVDVIIENNKREEVNVNFVSVRGDGTIDKFTRQGFISANTHPTSDRIDAVNESLRSIPPT
jgi:hypothetical protein